MSCKRQIGGARAFYLQNLLWCEVHEIIHLFCLSFSIVLSHYFDILVNSMTIWSVLKLPKIAWPTPLKLEENIRLERDSNPWPLRYRCTALPTELSSQVGAGFHHLRVYYEVTKCAAHDWSSITGWGHIVFLCASWVHNILTTVMTRIVVERSTDHAKQHSIC